METSPRSWSVPSHMVGVQAVLPAVPGVALAGEAAVIKGSLVVLDFGLDFCHVADS